MRDKNLYDKVEIDEIYEQAELNRCKSYLTGWFTGAIGMLSLTEIILPYFF